LPPDIKSAFIFPAFPHEYPADPFKGFPDMEEIFYFYLKEAAECIDPDLSGFNFITNNFLDSEVKTQYLTYIHSCTLSEYFKRNGLSPFFSAGYSMGIYASLCHSGAISFTDGLWLIRSAYDAIKLITGDEEFGMCSIIGLSREDIMEIIRSVSSEAVISNQNSGFAFVLSGRLSEIHELINKAKTEGALHTHLLKVNLPYHSTFLNETRKVFREMIKPVIFRKADTGIISLIDRRIMNEPADLKKEVTENLFSPLNWYKTQLELAKLGVNVFVECGLGDGLAKNARFIEGDYKFYSALDFMKRIEHGLQ
jgi:[acyl-carrier-protein] S-malonyltransferase